MQPVHIFAAATPDRLVAHAASSSINPDKHNSGALIHDLSADLGPVGAFTPGDAEAFGEAFPDWATWVAELRRARTHSLWLDPASGYYVFARNDLVNTSPELPGSTPPPDTEIPPEPIEPALQASATVPGASIKATSR